MAVTAWSLGTTFSGLLNMEVWEFIIWKFSDGHYGYGGSGYKKLIPTDLGLVSRFKCRQKQKLFLIWQSMQWSSAVNPSYFGQTGGLMGGTLAELAPNLFSAVPKGVRKSRTVAQALHNRGWVRDIRGALTVQVLMEYLQVWDPLEGVILQQGVPDQFWWKLSQSGSYSSKTAYAACFVGSIRFPPWRRIWKSWAPLRCKFFLWLAIKQRIWTADRLTKWGLPHQAACPLCDQE